MIGRRKESRIVGWRGWFRVKFWMENMLHQRWHAGKYKIFWWWNQGIWNLCELHHNQGIRKEAGACAWYMVWEEGSISTQIHATTGTKVVGETGVQTVRTFWRGRDLEGVEIEEDPIWVMGKPHPLPTRMESVPWYGWALVRLERDGVICYEAPDCKH